MGIPLNEMVVWDPYLINGGLTAERLRAAKVILWKGHCSVHQRFLPEHVDNVRAKYPGIKVIVHPECRWEVCQKADGIGSTEGLLKMIKDAPSGSAFAVGTEIHLVNRMGKEFAAQSKKVITLDDSGCLCTTMFRISPQHLVLGAGKLGGWQCSESDQSQRGRKTLGTGRAGPDVRDSVNAPRRTRIEANV